MTTEASSVNALVLGMGAYAYGKERRAVLSLKHMRRVKPYFLINKWENGSVSALLRRYDFEFSSAAFGYLGHAKPMWTMANLAGMPKMLVKLIRVYLKNRCKVILLLSIHSFVNAFPAILLLKLLGKAKIVFYVGDIPKDYAPHRALACLINRLADCIVVNSNAVKGGMVQIGVNERKIRVIYNGVEVTRFENAPPINFRAMFDWPKDSVVIGYVGQFSRKKGVEDFIEAADMISLNEHRCRFVMIGNLNESDGFHRHIAEQVKHQGRHAYIGLPGLLNEMETAYAGLDVVVVPSRHEDPAPNVNIEAMASGVPVVATRVGGTPELITDRETGFLVDKESSAQIAECVLRLVGDAELRKRMGFSGRERVRHLFDIKKNAILVEEVLLIGQS